MKQKIKMIGLDLDGTLLTSEKGVTPHTKQVLKQAIEQGVVVLVATGRPFFAVPEELRTFPGMRYIITTNGARVLDLKENKILQESSIPMETAEQIIDILKDYNALREIFVEGVGYGVQEKMEHAHEFFEETSMVDYILRTRLPVKSIKEKLQELQIPAEKIHAIFKDLDERKQARERILKLPGIVVTAAFGNTLEINKEGTSKAESLIRLGEQLGIKREEIMACGDGMNDYEMIGKAGFGVAMANGNPKVKEIADYVTASNEDDGVAKAIEKFVLV